MAEDTNKANTATEYSRAHAKPQSLRNYWITGGLITAVAIGYFFMTGGTKPSAQDSYKTVVKTKTLATSDSGMQQAGAENTRTPQIGRASGNDGAPIPDSPSENPDKDLDSSS